MIGTDLKLERDTKTLVVKGFWLENHTEISIPFITALARAFKRFMQLVEAEQADATALTPGPLREQIEQLLHTL
jgi:hypothetical protein